MRKVVYAGGVFYTGDELAAALIGYARELARNATADTVFIPARNVDGDIGRVELLLGPASQLASEPLTLAGPEVEDEALVARLHFLSARLASRRPGPEQPFLDADSSEESG